MQDQKEFKLDKAAITIGNPKYRSDLQVNATKNIKNLHNAVKKVIKLFNDYGKLTSEDKHKAKQRK